MNDPIFWRLVWKEYRTQRWFWVTVFGLAVVLQASRLYYWFVTAIPCDVDRGTDYYLFIAVSLPALFALGSGSVSFASEREDGTDELLQRVAAPAGRLFVSKLGFGLATTLLMFLVLAGVGWMFSGGYLPISSGGYGLSVICQLGSFGLAGLGFLLWGTFFSLLVKHVLVATCLAGGATVFSAFLIVNSPFTPSNEGGAWDTIAGFSRVAPQAIALAAIVLIANFFLAKQWLAARWKYECLDVADLRASRKTDVSPTVEILRVVDDEPPWRWQFRRLLWLEWQNARRTALYIIAGSFAMLHCLGQSFDTTVSLRANPGANYFILLVPVLMGVFAFHGEQRSGGFRFLGERGASPCAIWFSKHVVWLPLALAGSALLLLLSPPAVRLLCQRWSVFGYADAIMMSSQALLPAVWRPVYVAPWHWLWMLGNGPYALLLLPALLYAAGQVVSLLVRRAVTASFAGVVMGTALLLWLQTVLALQVPLTLSVLPILIVLFAVTFVRMRDWMEERNTRRAWGKVATAGLVPLALVALGVIVYRVYEVPSVEMSFLMDSPRAATDDERATASRYREAIQSTIPIPAETLVEEASLARLAYEWTPPTSAAERWVAENRGVIQQVVEATRQDRCSLLDPVTATLSEQETVDDSMPAYFHLAKLILFSGQVLEREGHLDEALERYSVALTVGEHVAQKGGLAQFVAGRALNEYVYYWMAGWATHPDQTPELLKRGFVRLQEHAETLPHPCQALNVHYAVLRRSLRMENAPALAQSLPFCACWLGLAIPWERARLRRQLNMTNCFEYWYLKDFEEAFRQRTFGFVGGGRQSNQGHLMQIASACPFVFTGRLSSGNWLYWQLRMSHMDIQNLPHELRVLVLSTVSHETRRRALMISLALAAFRMEHGQLPANLDALRPNYLPEVPLDPWIGREFGYRPDGVAGNTSWHENSVILPPDQPFLTSAGPFNANLTPASFAPESSREWTFVGADGRLVAECLAERAQESRERAESFWPPMKYWFEMDHIGRDFYAGILFPIAKRAEQK